MEKTKNINATIQNNLLKGVKIPYSISQPVIFVKDDKYSLAVFVFFFTKNDIESGMINRPTMWAIANIDNGDIIEIINTKEKDFSEASYNIKYDVRSNEGYDTSREYYDKAYDILDEVRRQIINKGIVNREKYDEYLNMILANIPEEYKRFYLDLSI